MGPSAACIATATRCSEANAALGTLGTAVPERASAARVAGSIGFDAAAKMEDCLPASASQCVRHFWPFAWVVMELSRCISWL